MDRGDHRAAAGPDGRLEARSRVTARAVSSPSRRSASETRVTVQMDHETNGLMEQLGSALGVDSRRVKGDLERFKELVESRGIETGAWRGEVEQGQRVR